MKSGGGKNKGNAFERKVSRLLGQWLYDDPFSLWRISDSGARSTKYRRKKKLVIPGDIGPYKPEALNFPFGVECKFVNTWSLDQLFKSDDCLLRRWWKKINRECDSSFIPMLIVTKNFYPTLMILRKPDVSGRFFGIDRMAFHSHPFQLLWIYPLQEVLDNVDGPEYLRWIISKRLR